MNYKLIFLLILSSLTLKSYSLDSLSYKTKELILESMEFKDLNPTHAPYTDSLWNVFRSVLSEYLEPSNGLNKDSIKSEMFSNFDRNAEIEYEDSPDILRMKVRRLYCLSTIAFCSEYEKSFIYLDLARYLMVSEMNSEEAEFLGKQLIGLNLTEILIKISESKLEKSDITKMKELTVKSYHFIPESYYRKLSSLIKELEILIE